MPTLSTLKLNTQQASVVSEAKSYEQQIEEYQYFLDFLGIELGDGLPDLNLRETNLKGTPCIRVARNLMDLNAHEDQLMKIAEELQAPIIHAMPLDSFGATTHLPGIGPVPIARVYGGGLFSEWGLSGHHITPAPVQLIRNEAEKQMPLVKRPYTQYLKQAMEWKATITDKEGTQRLVEAAAKAPDVVGMAAAMQMSLGRGTAQGVFTFSPDAELTGETLPTFTGEDWMITDLGRAVMEETTMGRRAMTYIHSALIHALDLQMYSVVPASVGEGIKGRIETARTTLSSGATLGD